MKGMSGRITKVFLQEKQLASKKEVVCVTESQFEAR